MFVIFPSSSDGINLHDYDRNGGILQEETQHPHISPVSRQIPMSLFGTPMQFSLWELLDEPSVIILGEVISMQWRNTVNKITLTILTLLVITGLILSACSSIGISTWLAGTSWKLFSYGPAGTQTSAAPGIQTSLTFGTDGRVSGNLGCNSFGGDYQVKNGNIVFSQMISTIMACPEPQMTQEITSLHMMSGSTRFQVAANTLTIYAANGSTAIIFSK
jgi:heat shock protein HslJ